MTAIANKKLKGDDLAKKGWTIDFAKAPYNKLDCAMAQRLLERRPVLLLTEEDEKGALQKVFGVTALDILKVFNFWLNEKNIKKLK